MAHLGQREVHVSLGMCIDAKCKKTMWEATAYGPGKLVLGLPFGNFLGEKKQKMPISLLSPCPGCQKP